jgi:endonuclease/exonuclease/phosphatase family metal-dependent hydrolase
MKLNIVTSNIRFHTEKDEQNSWTHRRTVLSEILSNLAPDILGTQEGREPQLKDLLSLLSNMEMIESHRQWINERMYPCLFYRPEKIEVNESGDIWLSETPKVPGSSSFDSAFPRLCTWAKLTIKKENQKLFVVNCHLDHVKEETRVSQVKVLIKETQARNIENLPMILMGDFNDGPKGPVRLSLSQEIPEISDPWLELSLPEGPSHHSFSGENPTGARIDWILLDKRLKANSIQMIKEHRDGLYPSDHFPVSAEIII